MRTGRLITCTMSLVAAVAVAACSSDENPPDPTEGDWHGAVQVPGQPLEIGVSFAGDGTATIDIPAQGLTAVPLRDVKSDRTAVEFAIPNIPGDPRFRGRYESERITGDLSQSGQSFPVSFERGKVAGPSRPQEPKPPYPYRSEDVTYRSGDLTVAGTLTTPQGPGPFPAVLMITGSGAQNRDEEIMGHKPFLLFADTLTRAGYAVLRTDDRGIGGTGGDLGQANYTDLAGDAAAGVRFLRARTDIDPARVGLFGHSEGGYLAPLVAAAPESGVAFAVLMAGPSVPGSDVLVEQTKVIMAANGATPQDIDTEVANTAEMSRLLRAGDVEGAKAFLKRANAAAPADKRVPDAQVDAQITPYFAALIRYDPAPALSALRIPVLAFFGGSDLQVLPAQNEQPMRDLLAAGPDSTVHTFAGLNHLMQPSASGNPSEYAVIETTVSPEVLTFVTDWLTRRFPPK
ncbi:alpha/beta hydrolase family protein [Nocardia bovistercoris]|uniref:Alpha/beta fold hydrolase n=1 Tax=Nocardia bovistercoris TaxID=2785916 RepID=A0A931N453_9NOCA|nr:alpha/beta fold hydrolase [Nocardia bovistercoris]MBH0781370.1 alpha/beta fold hydrolase [Nocardia bovistercoris]